MVKTQLLAIFQLFHSSYATEGIFFGLTFLHVVFVCGKAAIISLEMASPYCKSKYARNFFPILAPS